MNQINSHDIFSMSGAKFQRIAGDNRQTKVSLHVFKGETNRQTYLCCCSKYETKSSDNFLRKISVYNPKSSQSGGKLTWPTRTWTDGLLPVVLTFLPPPCVLQQVWMGHAPARFLPVIHTHTHTALLKTKYPED